MKYQYIYYVDELSVTICIERDNKKDADKAIKEMGLDKMAKFQERINKIQQ